MGSKQGPLDSGRSWVVSLRNYGETEEWVLQLQQVDDGWNTKVLFTDFLSDPHAADAGLVLDEFLQVAELTINFQARQIIASSGSQEVLF